MTIALGLLASDGLVMVADRQETHGNLIKLDRGKMSAYASRKEDEVQRAIVMAGAGDAHHIDAIGQKLLNGVFTLDRKDNVNEFMNAMLRDFYRDYILPFAQYPESQRPDIELLIGSGAQYGQQLWVSQKSVFRPAGYYVAIGVGSLTAYPLLARLYPPSSVPDLKAAIVIAMYVIAHVKEFTDGCGKNTDIAALQNGRMVLFNRGQIDRLERAVLDYSAATEPAALWKHLGDTVPETVPSATLAETRLKRAIHELDLSGTYDWGIE
jgi:hypothetical protein